MPVKMQTEGKLTQRSSEQINARWHISWRKRLVRCLTRLSPWLKRSDIWTDEYKTQWALCVLSRAIWTKCPIVLVFLTPSYSSFKWHILWKHFMVRRILFSFFWGVTQCHTQCFLCKPHKGAYIIYSMVRPWGFCRIVLEDLMLFVYLRIFQYFCGHTHTKNAIFLLFTPSCLPHRNPLQREKVTCRSSTGWLASVQCLHLHPWQSSEWPSLTAVLDSVSQAQLKPGKQHDMLGC